MKFLREREGERRDRNREKIRRERIKREIGINYFSQTDLRPNSAAQYFDQSRQKDLPQPNK